jgi:hypothetical protein
MFFVQILHATQQIPDNIIYKGEQYKLTRWIQEDLVYGTYLLEPYLDKDKDKWKWLRKAPSTALWRGYIATFEIVDNKLLLKEIERRKKGVHDERESESILEEFLSVAETKDSIFKIDWYNGIMLLSNTSSKHDNDHFFLEFRNGILIKESRMNYQEYSTYEDEWGDSTTKAFEAKLEKEYKKIYGVPISDFERSADLVTFNTSKSGRGLLIQVSRKIASGASALYDLDKVPKVPKKKSDTFRMELSIEEWLAFIKAIYECRIDEWQEYRVGWQEELYSSSKKSKWRVEISATEKFTFRGDLKYPPNWAKFMKILDDIETKLKEQ